MDPGINLHGTSSWTVRQRSVAGPPDYALIRSQGLRLTLLHVGGKLLSELGLKFWRLNLTIRTELLGSRVRLPREWLPPSRPQAGLSLTTLRLYLPSSGFGHRL